MNIFIPTMGRVNSQKTLSRLPSSIKKKTILTVDALDYKKYKSEYKSLQQLHKCQLVSLPEGIKGIAATREYIGKELAEDSFIMLDDDIRFLYRKEGDHTRLYQGMNDLGRVEALFSLLEKKLEKYTHVGVSNRATNYVIRTSYRFNDRCIRILGFRKKEFNECEHGRVEVMEDFDVTLQLLRKGYKNYITYLFAQDQDQTQAPGGCSIYRTQELHSKSAMKLQKLHPEFVILKHKKNKTGGEFGIRTEVRIAWQQAYQSSITNPFFL